MALVTGSDCSLSIDAKEYATVVSSFQLASTTSSVTYPTLKSTLAGQGTETWKLTVVFAYDSGETSSLYDALWTAAGKSIAFVATAGKSTFTGKAIAVHPSVPAKAGEVSEVTVDMDVDGDVLKAPVAGGK